MVPGGIDGGPRHRHMPMVLMPYACAFQEDSEESLAAVRAGKRVLSPEFQVMEDSASDEEPEWDADEGDEDEDDDTAEVLSQHHDSKENMTPYKIPEVNRALHTVAKAKEATAPKASRPSTATGRPSTTVKPTAESSSRPSTARQSMKPSAGISSSSKTATPTPGALPAGKKKGAEAKKQSGKADSDDDFTLSAKRKTKPKLKPAAEAPEPTRAQPPKAKRLKSIESDAAAVHIDDDCTLCPCLKDFCRSLAIIGHASTVACPAYLRPSVESAFNCATTDVQFGAFGATHVFTQGGATSVKCVPLFQTASVNYVFGSHDKLLCRNTTLDHEWLRHEIYCTCTASSTRQTESLSYQFVYARRTFPQCPPTFSIAIESPTKGFGVRSLVRRKRGEILFAMEGVVYRDGEDATAGGPRAFASAWQEPMLTGACYRWGFEFAFSEVTLAQLTSSHIASLINIGTPNCSVRTTRHNVELSESSNGGFTVVQGSNVFAVVVATTVINPNDFLGFKTYGGENADNILDAMSWCIGL